VPTIHRERGFRFFFWSNERNEPPHVHVESGDNEAKIWLAPVALARSIGFGPREVRDLLAIVREHRAEMEQAWHDHFST
jgi:Domain of unknown function (DUF4160)